MTPTLDLGQIVTADLAAYRTHDPAIGDIVVFNPPAGAQDERCGTAVPSGARAMAGRARWPLPGASGPLVTTY